MCLKVLQTLLAYLVVCAVAFEDIFYVYGQASQEMVEQGRKQYQLLQERGNLPQYGSCWKAAVEHMEESCRNLSEETQSDVALHVTNCFLEMSGDETYNCELDKKPNLRAICIRTMTDRAFNVYTEFYTHTQNICWFLRGQVWYETITENTYRVGKQLESSANNQEEILKSQRESLTLQEKLLNYGRNLERTMDDFYVSTKQHQEVLTVMSGSLKGLQSWLVGEISWVDLVVFYVAAAILIMVFTSTNRTAAARLPIWFLLIANAIIERLICAAFVANTSNAEIHLVQNDMYKYIWWSRKLFFSLAICILVYKACCYKDILYVNNALLQRIYDQNLKITEALEKFKKGDKEFNCSNGHISFLDESNSFKKPFDYSPTYNENLDGNYKIKNYSKETVETHTKTVLANGDIKILNNALSSYKTEGPKTHKYCDPLVKPISARQRISPSLNLQSNGRYNLRNRHGTPESNV